MQVYVFSGQTLGGLALTVGTWLFQNPNAKIRCAAQTQSAAEGITLTIFYDYL